MFRAAAVCLLCLACEGIWLAAQEPREPKSPQLISSSELNAAIDKLGNLDYEVRAAASRAVRRTQSSQAVPALIGAASSHADGYVRYRALVLLTGFNDPRATAAMRSAMTSSNDRLRAVAYAFFEHHPDRALTSDLLAALDKEVGEFVRPSLIRALAAAELANDDVRIRTVLVREAGRGQDFFRSAVIESLGDYKAQYAVDTLLNIAKIEGPLQNDSAIALGKIGDKRAVDILAALQRTAPKASQPYIAAGICLLGVNCQSNEQFLTDTLRFADRNQGYQDLLRSSAAALAQLAVASGPLEASGPLGASGPLEKDALDTFFAVGGGSSESTRAPVSLALATVALRRTASMLAALEAHPSRAAVLDLLAEGFDGLEEDYEKERFFAFVRRAYWEAAEGSSRRALIQALIEKLDF